MRRLVFALMLLLLPASTIPDTTGPVGATRNLVLVTLDGVRVQEIFGGLDTAVLARGLRPGERLEDTDAYREYWAPTRHERRRRLMPFFWGTLMRRHGSIAGDRVLGSRLTLANRHRISYPGYSEMLTGRAHDDVITSNDFGQTPYPSVLEHLRSRLGLTPAQVAVFASWSAMPRIVAHTPGAFFVNAGAQRYEHPDAEVRALSERQFGSSRKGDRRDAFTFALAMAHLRSRRPRVLYISLDDTDAFAHEGRYPEVLDALARADGWLEELWTHLQSDPMYRDRTALVVTVDHGRGRNADRWHEHAADVDGAQDVWAAFVVPDSPRRGPWGPGPALRQGQIAATLARIMGVDYTAAHPDAAPAIDGVLAH